MERERPGTSFDTKKKAASIGLSHLATERDTPTFFPIPYEDGMHEKLHRAVRDDIGPISKPWTGSADELFNATSKNLDSIKNIRGELRIPATGEVLASDVTPKEAHDKLLEWHRSKTATSGDGGACRG